MATIHQPTVRELHTEAMHLAQHALIAREQGQASKAEDHAKKAYEKEKAAFNRFLEYLHETNDPRVEPTRSNLALSAASLAYQAGLLDDALRLVEQGLQGTPSWRVQADLQQLKLDIALQQRQLQASPPTPDTLELTLVGSAILDGGAIRFDEFSNRLHSMVQAVRLMLQHQLQLSIQAARVALNPIVHPVQAGSAIITVQFQRPDNQTRRTRAVSDTDVSTSISNVVRAIGYINDSNLAAFAEMLPTKEAQKNFLNHLRVLAPDGEQVTHMGLRGNEQALLFARTADEIQMLIDDLPIDQPSPQESITVDDLPIDQPSPQERIIVIGSIIRIDFRSRTIVVRGNEEQREYTREQPEHPEEQRTYTFRYRHRHYLYELGMFPSYDGERVRVVGRWDGNAYEIEEIEIYRDRS